MEQVQIGDRIVISAEVVSTYWGGKFFIAKTRQGVELMLHAGNADPAPADDARFEDSIKDEAVFAATE